MHPDINVGAIQCLSTARQECRSIQSFFNCLSINVGYSVLFNCLSINFGYSEPFNCLSINAGYSEPFNCPGIHAGEIKALLNPGFSPIIKSYPKHLLISYKNFVTGFQFSFQTPCWFVVMHSYPSATQGKIRGNPSVDR